jgi:hypothetical protein
MASRRKFDAAMFALRTHRAAFRNPLTPSLRVSRDAVAVDCDALLVVDALRARDVTLGANSDLAAWNLLPGIDIRIYRVAKE